MKRVLVLTGKRGGYDAMLPMLRLMQDSEEFDLTLFVCDQHMMEKFGSTYLNIKNFRCRYSEPEYGVNADQAGRRSMNLAKYMDDISQVFIDHGTDLLMLFGDRGEALAGAVAATQMGIPIAHIQGGDKTGTIDDVMRHAISKMAHIHFVSNRDAAQRLESMGERNEHIWITGDLHIDALLAQRAQLLAEDEMYGCHGGPTEGLILLFHPDTNRPGTAGGDFNEVLYGTADYKGPVHVIYPCSDPGHDEIIEQIDEIQKSSNYTTYKNIPYPEFVALMMHSKAIIGNSSAGVIEAPYLGLPSLTIGDRQTGRWRDSGCHRCPPRADAVSKFLTDLPKIKVDCSQHYGDGTAATQIVDLLSRYNLKDDGVGIKRWR